MSTSTAQPAEYDIIFAGGGTCACVTASRLAAAAPKLKILLIEAGKHTKGLPNFIQPALYPTHLISPESGTLTFHSSKPSAALGGREVVVPVAHCFGGGSSVNVLNYTRAAASDYDDWETIHENPGWGSKSLIPLAEKLETFQVNPSARTHGDAGPIKVSYGRMFSNVGQEFLNTAAKYDPSREFTDDVNDFKTINAYGKWPKYIDEQTGKRSDVAHNYIYDNEEANKNVFILDQARVKRVIFEGNRAVGVEWVKECAAGSTATDEEQVNTVRATKLVVLSAGALGSPAILERSGIGAGNVLSKHGVDVLVDLPGVGENYMDHPNLLWAMNAAEETHCLEEVFLNPALAEKLTEQWKKDGSTILASNCLDSGIKLRPDERELKQIGPAFRSQWDSFFVPSPDKPVIWIGNLATGFPVLLTGEKPTRKYFSMNMLLEYPLSKGYAHITSGQDAFAPLNFYYGFLDDSADLAVLRFGYKKAREIARRMSLFRGEHPGSNPAFSADSKARLISRDGPYPIDEPDIEYSTEDDAAIDEFLKKWVGTSWHSFGTCAMKPREKGGVVDPSLNVYGVQGLKVIDGSVPPSNVSANTNNTVIIIGEKAAEIVAAELGIDLK